ncbi:MAG: gamma-glutamyl-gamma-aminobutyrate hydrolase family protein [Ardenticatenia bacterium]|nr:gamma-glutamyl-gamma-aminobutyrate hydrolase family protein [Ardenticatenia bacterium]
MVHSTPNDDPSVHHPVTFEPHSLLARVMGTARVEVNTFHHQAVDRVGGELRAVAWSPDGIIEGVEAEGFPFVIGVQWHPELLTSPHDRLFEAFVRAAAQFAATRAPAVGAW